MAQRPRSGPVAQAAVFADPFVVMAALQKKWSGQKNWAEEMVWERVGRRLAPDATEPVQVLAANRLTEF